MKRCARASAPRPSAPSGGSRGKRYCIIVGTSVRERKYEVSIAKTTAMASGTKRDFAAPAMKTTGTKTIQMHRVETSAGTAISADPSRIAAVTDFFIAERCRCTFSTATVASSTRIPTARAIPPRVMRLSVCPSAPRTMMETRSESGIETRTISVLRQLPRKRSIISPVSPAAMMASRTTPSIAPRTKTD